MPKEKSPPVNLDKYLEGRNHKYMTYEKASQLYGLPYWGFVSVAKEAKAICFGVTDVWNTISWKCIIRK